MLPPMSSHGFITIARRESLPDKPDNRKLTRNCQFQLSVTRNKNFLWTRSGRETFSLQPGLYAWGPLICGAFGL